jgi:hypothetical protein
MSHVERTLTRILEIHESSELFYERRWSHHALYREYMRRVAIWGQEFGWAISYNLLCYTDLATLIQPTNVLPEDVAFIFEKHPLSLRTRRYFFNALKWALLEDSEKTNLFSLFNPYEPIFLIYERGGFVTGEHGFIEVTGGSFFVGERETSDVLNYSPLDLSEEVLDAIDLQGNIKSD